MSSAFGNTNQNQFGQLNFTDWSQVASMFGTPVVQALQNNNVPLSQVGKTIGSLGIAQQTGPGQFGAANPQFVSSGFTLADAINAQQGGLGGQQQQQGVPFGQGGPNAALSNLGAAALVNAGFGPNYGGTPIYNPNPANQPNPQSGVGQIMGPTQGTPLTQAQAQALTAQGQGLQMFGGNQGKVANPVTGATAFVRPPVLQSPGQVMNAVQPTPVYGGVGAAAGGQVPFGTINPPPLYGQGGGGQAPQPVQAPNIAPPQMPQIPQITAPQVPQPAPGAPGPSMVQNPVREGLMSHAVGSGPVRTTVSPVTGMPMPIKAFQYGGVVNGPTWALMGEAGPEAVIPLRRNPDQGTSTLPTVPTATPQIGPPNPTAQQLAAANAANMVGPPNPQMGYNPPYIWSPGVSGQSYAPNPNYYAPRTTPVVAPQVGPPNPTPQQLAAANAAAPAAPGAAAGGAVGAGGGGTGVGAGRGFWNPYSGMTATGQPMTAGQKQGYALASGIGQIGQAIAGGFQGAANAYGAGAAAIGKIQSGIPNPSSFKSTAAAATFLPPEQDPHSDRYQYLTVV